MSEHRIPVFRPSVSEREIAYVTEALRSGWWGLGPRTAEFETRFAQYIGVRRMIGMNSASAALHLAVMLAAREGSEVVTTPMTFVSTNHAILYNKSIPVFADIDPHTLNIDPAAVERAITHRTSAIMIVHYGGHPCDLDALRAIARRANCALIEDAAHATGARYKGTRIGADSELAVFSFHAVKNLAMGEGGAIATVRDDYAERLRRLRWMGITRNTWDRDESSAYEWFYNVEELGYKYHLSDISAAIGLAQLERLDELNARRRRIVEIYRAELRNLGWLELPSEAPHVVSAWHNFVVKLDRRDDLIRHLGERGISTGVHYIPNHLYEMYAPYRTRLPVTETVWRRIVTLPLFPDLTEEEIERVVQGVRSFSSANASAPILPSGS